MDPSARVSWAQFLSGGCLSGVPVPPPPEQRPSSTPFARGAAGRGAAAAAAAAAAGSTVPHDTSMGVENGRHGACAPHCTGKRRREAEEEEGEEAAAEDESNAAAAAAATPLLPWPPASLFSAAAAAGSGVGPAGGVAPPHKKARCPLEEPDRRQPTHNRQTAAAALPAPPSFPLGGRPEDFDTGMWLDQERSADDTGSSEERDREKDGQKKLAQASQNQTGCDGAAAAARADTHRQGANGVGRERMAAESATWGAPAASVSTASNCVFPSLHPSVAAPTAGVPPSASFQPPLQLQQAPPSPFGLRPLASVALPPEEWRQGQQSNGERGESGEGQRHQQLTEAAASRRTSLFSLSSLSPSHPSSPHFPSPLFPPLSVPVGVGAAPSSFLLTPSSSPCSESEAGRMEVTGEVPVGLGIMYPPPPLKLWPAGQQQQQQQQSPGGLAAHHPPDANMHMED